MLYFFIFVSILSKDSIMIYIIDVVRHVQLALNLKGLHYLGSQ